MKGIVEEEGCYTLGDVRNKFRRRSTARRSSRSRDAFMLSLEGRMWVELVGCSSLRRESAYCVRKCREAGDLDVVGSPNRWNEVVPTPVFGEKKHGLWVDKGAARRRPVCDLSWERNSSCDPRDQTAQGKKMHLFLFFISGQKEGSLGLVGE